jgi:hypothetical protein
MPILSDGTNKIHSSVLDDIHGSWNQGPLTLVFDVSLEPPGLKLDISLQGHKVGKFDVNTEDTTVELDFKAWMAEVEGSLTADLEKRQVEGEFQLSLLEEHKQWSGPIFHW